MRKTNGWNLNVNSSLFSCIRAICIKFSNSSFSCLYTKKNSIIIFLIFKITHSEVPKGVSGMESLCTISRSFSSLLLSTITQFRGPKRICKRRGILPVTLWLFSLNLFLFNQTTHWYCTTELVCSFSVY